MTEQEMREKIQNSGIELADLGRVVGLSAYELAVQQGYKGSLDEWLESLKYVSSDEYKLLTEQVEAAAATITESLKQADIKIQEITDLVTLSLRNIDTAKTEAINAVGTAQTSATNAIQQAQNTAENSVSEKLSEALQALATSLENATKSVRETGESWNTQINSAGAVQVDLIKDTGNSVKEEIEQAKDAAISDIQKNITLVSGGTFTDWKGGNGNGDQ